jgi:hypothetical protein
MFKGIVSRDLVVCFLVSFDRSEVSTHKDRVYLLLKFRFRVKFFRFSRLGVPVVSLLCEWSFCCSPVLGDHYSAHANSGLAE